MKHNSVISDRAVDPAGAEQPRLDRDTRGDGACSGEDRTPESVAVQAHPAWPPATPPSREHGWPQDVELRTTARD